MKDALLERQLEEETEDMLRLRFLTKETAHFFATEGGFAGIEMEDVRYERVQILRMFPFMEEKRYLSVRTMDDKCREIGIIKELSEFPKETEALILQQLQIRYFTPVITRVSAIREEYGFAYFTVTTNHGECRFTIRTGGNSIVHLSETRILISDIDENRFEIPDVEALTPAERKRLDLYL